VLATASLELKAEKQSAHSRGVISVAFSPDGATIVSGSDDQTIKVWDANIRPFDASEWEEVDISGMEKDNDGEVEIEGLGYVGSNYWRNKVTGDLRKEYSTTGARLSPRTDQSLGCRYLSPPYFSPQPKTKLPHACYSFPGAQGGEAERAQPRGDVRGLFARWQDHRLGLLRQDDQSLGCRRVGADTLEPLAQI
jgi:hypothetical protein